VSPRDQANAFRIHFASISRRPRVSHHERTEHKNLRKSVNEYIKKIDTPNSPDAKPFTMAELNLPLKDYQATKLQVKTVSSTNLSSTLTSRYDVRFLCSVTLTGPQVKFPVPLCD
jgi:hypothetical protein